MHDRFEGRAEAYVLRKQPYQESSFLVDLLTRTEGRIKVLVRGRKRKNPVELELFTFAAWHLKEGRTFYFLNEYDLLQQFRLTGREIWIAYYLNELLLRLFPQHQASPEIFEIYHRVLEALKEGKEIEPYLRQFEGTLLAFLGILPDFAFDAQGEEIRPDLIYSLLPDEGFIPGKHEGLLTVKGSTLHHILENRPLEREEAINYRDMMRILLSPLLGSKPLQSRIWLQKLYGNKTKSAGSLLDA